MKLLRRGGCTSSWLLVAAATATTAFGFTDIQPTYASENGRLELTLEIGPALYNGSDGLLQYLVGYNGTVGAPTIRVAPGDQVVITLLNNLPAETCNTFVPELFNAYHAVDLTNLHFHGLHIPESAHPNGLAVRPGESYTYDFVIPDYHMGGTHWYHPHFPGSSSLQAGAGGNGLFIIEDVTGDLPPEYESMPELPMRIQFLNLTYLQYDYTNGTDGSYLPLCKQFCLPVEQRDNCSEFFFQDGPLEGAYNTTLAPDGLEYELTLVNGMERPTFDMEANTWYRVRVLYVPTRFRTIEPAFDGCEVKLLAKDGVYLMEAPRDIITAGYMTSGSRADFLVRCAEPGLHEFKSLSEALDSSNWIASQKRPSLDRVLAYLNVTASDGPATSDEKVLPAFTLNRPCYVADTLSIAKGDAQDYVITGGLLPEPPIADPLPIDRPPCCANTSYYDINGLGIFNEAHRADSLVAPQQQADERHYDFKLQVGSLWDLDYYGSQIHPVHYHMYKYQILELPEVGAHSDYWQVGDYHDVLQLTIPDSGYYGMTKIRLNVAQLTGQVLGHCHFYRHTDRGMAYQGLVEGQEGTVSSQLSNCYVDGANRGGFEYVTATGDGGTTGDKNTTAGGGDQPMDSMDDMEDEPDHDMDEDDHGHDHSHGDHGDDVDDSADMGEDGDGTTGDTTTSVDDGDDNATSGASAVIMSVIGAATASLLLLGAVL